MVRHGLSLGEYDRTAVEGVLSEVNYYRLRGYWMTLEKNGSFAPGTTFRDVMDIYNLDCGLSVIMGSLCERVEIKFRTSFAYRVSHAIGPDALYRSEAFRSRSLYDGFESELERAVRHGLRGHVPCVEHNMRKYGRLPVWAAVEILSFGTISRLYGNLGDRDLRDAISDDFGTSTHYLKSWIENLIYIRNVCAHHNRLYNRIITKRPALYPSDKRRFGNGRAFATFLVLSYLYRSISPSEFMDALADLDGLLARHPTVDLAPMGLPASWEHVLGESVSREIV